MAVAPAPTVAALKKQREQSQKDAQAAGAAARALRGPTLPDEDNKLAPAPVAQKSEPEFFSEDGTEIDVHLPDGRKAIVGAIPRTLPKAFWKAAGKAGCIASGMAPRAQRMVPQAPPEEEVPMRMALIKKAIVKAANSAEDAPGFEDAFTRNGLPNLEYLSRECGFSVQTTERDVVWQQVEKEIQATENNNGRMTNESAITDA
jgi:hypothetical protein